MAQYSVSFTIDTDAPLDVVQRHLELQSDEHTTHEVISRSGKTFPATLSEIKVEYR